MFAFAAIRKDTGLYCGYRLRKGEVFVYVGPSQNLKDRKDLWWEHSKPQGPEGLLENKFRCPPMLGARRT